MNRNKPEVSLIIPIYNVEEYLDRCISSVLSQTYGEMEILLMVGRCQDKSLQKCIKWQEIDDRIIIVSRKDTSLGDARNYGLKLAIGSYIVFVDADDYLEPDFIHKLREPLHKNKNVDITCCGFDKFWQDNTKKAGWIPTVGGELSSNFELYFNLIQYGVVWNKMYRRKWLMAAQIEMFDGCHEDDAMHFMLAAQVEVLYLIQEPLYHYNAGNERSLLHDIKNRRDYFKAMGFALDYLKGFSTYKQQRGLARKYIIDRLRGILSETNYHIDMIQESKKMLEEMFPEVIREAELSKNRKKQLYDKVILFGGGHDCARWLKRIGKNKVKGIVDNNVMLQGTCLEGIPVFSLDELVKKELPATVLITSSRYYYEISNQLQTAGVCDYMPPEEYILEKAVAGRTKKNIFLLNTPEHTNIGDHAIAEAEKLFFEEYLPDYHVIEITDWLYSQCRFRLRQYVAETDIIIITGGGFLGSLWLEHGEENVRNILKDYKENRIIIFPQTMYFEENAYGKRERASSEKVYTQCKDLTILLRDEGSYKTAAALINNHGRCLQIPDMVLSLKGYGRKSKRQNRGALCLKNCIESLLTEQRKQKIDECLSGFGILTEKISMHASCDIYPEQRNGFIKNKIDELGEYKIVITDALHCMIFCAVSGTPCVALNNISGKVKGVYEYIAALPYIKFVDDLEQIEEVIGRIMDVSSTEYSFAYEPFFAQIKEIIQEDR